MSNNKNKKFSKGKDSAKKNKGGSNKKAGSAKGDCPLAELGVTCTREDMSGDPNFINTIYAAKKPSGGKKSGKAKCDHYHHFLKLKPGTYEASAKPPKSEGYTLAKAETVSLGAGDKKNVTLELKRAKIIEVTPKAKREQFVNLKKAKANPEHGRIVKVEAKLDQELPGVTVYFDFEPDAKNFDLAKMSAAQKATIKKSAKTDKKGVAKTDFTVSAAGGDKFKVLASLFPDPKDPVADAKKSADIEVWRKVWYQFTHAEDFNVPNPAKSVAAWNDVWVNLEAADRVTFARKDAPPRTYYPEWMVKKGGGDNEVAVVGGHNWPKLKKRYKKEKDKPVKAHIVICEHQWDPEGSVAYRGLISSSPSVELKLPEKIVKPALKGNLVVSGSWETTGHSKKKGKLKEENIVLEKSRSWTTKFKVQLPAGAPTPTPTAQVLIKLVLRCAGSYLGESAGKEIMAVYDDSDEVDFNDTITHEIGHSLNQTPESGKQPGKLLDHPHQYTGCGGSGSHCNTVSGGGVGTLEYDDDEEEDVYKTGICVMYHSKPPSSETGSLHKYCDKCVPYVKLQDMAKLA